MGHLLLFLPHDLTNAFTLSVVEYDGTAVGLDEECDVVSSFVALLATAMLLLAQTKYW